MDLHSPLIVSVSTFAVLVMFDRVNVLLSNITISVGLAAIVPLLCSKPAYINILNYQVNDDVPYVP
jgi:hypothetical protein